jgi:hypothetical protein
MDVSTDPEPSWKDRPVSVGEPVVAATATLPTPRIDVPPNVIVKKAKVRAKKHKKARGKKAAPRIRRR